MNIQKEHGREAFEEFEFQKRPFASKKVLFQKYDPARIGDCDSNEGKYYCAEMQEKWEIWQHVAQVAPKGFVLVPKELSDGAADNLALNQWEVNKTLLLFQYSDLNTFEFEKVRLNYCKNMANKFKVDYKTMIEAAEGK
ncbi:hypothetical protein RFH42_10530 [Acinetobacter rudis]|uniref:hypothetical protein n=1 Tax=Acinetobacter rudis TaxID=632955 RepID=UPI00280DD906|nr:hypothetical protein [Acinetobacter rudis]MDQ8953394.1 hypothetical protein [Acinetobacter rudis]